MLGTGIFKIDAEMAEMMPFKDEVCTSLQPSFQNEQKGKASYLMHTYLCEAPFVVSPCVYVSVAYV